MGSDLYTIVINGKPQGPYELDELTALKLEPGTFVRRAGMDDYKEAHELPELRALLGFAYQQTAPQYFASFDQRLLAMVIDFFFIILAYIFVMLLCFMFVADKEQKILVFAACSPFIWLVKLLYNIFAEASPAQGTVGKRLLNIRVTDALGNRITLKCAFIRNMSKVLSILPFFFGYLYSFLNSRKQCWHDIAANTLVIKDRLI